MQGYLKAGLAAAALSLAAPVALAEAPATPAQAHQGHAQQPAASTYTDAQIDAFVAASAEIEPINTAGAASPEARAQANTQIAAVLQRHNLDAATYNGIVEAMRADTAFAARVNAARSQEG